MAGWRVTLPATAPVLLGEGLLASLALWCYRRRHGRGKGGVPVEAVLPHGATRAGGLSYGSAAGQKVSSGLLAGRVRRRACERRAAAAGWQESAEPTMPRLNSQACPLM